ncbi:MAG: DciA family protein [Planctomycetota bacterium]|nr:DciA family protein [Planctomycetota bacterium]
MQDPRTSHASGSGKSAKRGPRPVADLVGGALRSLGMPSAKLTEGLRRAWALAADDAWRDHTRLRRIEGGVLDVGVRSEALRAELTNFHRDRLLSVMRAALPDVSLVGLRFVTDPADGDGV